MSNEASQLFSSGFNCAQAVFASAAESLGLDRSTALKIASGFGAGMARRQEVCGAVTGGLMALGWVHGFDHEKSGGRDKIYQLSQSFMDEFEKNHGSLVCRDLLKVDLSTPQGHEAMKTDLRERVCLPCVQGAAQILAKYLSK